MDKIWPPDMDRMRRIRPLAREDRQENDEQFRNRLEEMAEEQRNQERDHHEEDAPAAEQGASESKADGPDEAEFGIGRNLNLRT